MALDIVRMPRERARELLAKDRLIERVKSVEPTSISDALITRRAAVAALIRYQGDEPSVLLMKRVERDGDRWSGHMAFPGGRAEETDADLIATAVRETREEVGIDLNAGAEVLGKLDDVMAIAKGKFIPMAITPVIFLETAPQEVVLGPEATATVWLPLVDALSGELSGIFDYKLGPVPLELPCWRWEGHTVWGLTYRMLAGFLELVTK